MSTAQTPIAEGDRVTFFTNGGRVDATGTVERIWTEDGVQVAAVLVDPDPFVLAGSHIVELADLTKLARKRSAR